MNIYEASLQNALIGDLYSLKEFIYELKLCDNFYFKLEEGSFVRPSIYIKLVSSTVTPHDKYYRDFNASIMIQYFSEDFFDAQVKASAIAAALSGYPIYNDVLLPRYDFSQEPPQKCSINDVMGPRIDPSSVVSAGVIQESNRAFVATVTFDMRSPLTSYPEGVVIETIDWELLTDRQQYPHKLSASVKADAALEEILG